MESNLPIEADNEIKKLRDWPAVRDAFDQFPAPKLGFDFNGEPTEVTWIFRGDKGANCGLKPAIERVAKGKPSWAAVEFKVLEEFQSRARMHINPRDIPPGDTKLSWLALMQHYGIPTRLLDFTFSPYLGLYFALRNRQEAEQLDPVTVRAIDAEMLMDRAAEVS